MKLFRNDAIPTIWYVLIAAGQLAPTLSGCNGKNEGTVSGTVTYQGKAMPGGYVIFNVLNQDGTVLVSRSTGIENNGSYHIHRVPVGPAKITVQGPTGQMSQTPNGMPFRAKPSVVIPDRYSMVKEANLDYTVSAGPQTHDIELK